MKIKNSKELILEVVKDGYRRLVFRTDNGKGTTLFLEESDLIDFSRPLAENGDFNVFFTMRSFWNSFTDFTSNEGLMKRQVWHQASHEWLNLEPIFIHEDINALVKKSLSEATRELAVENQAQIDGIRSWLRKLPEPSTELDKAINSPKKYRHAV